MSRVYFNASPLLLGMFLLMIGNGLQGTALGVRGGIEGFGNLAMGFVMSGYFLGFLFGAHLTPWLLRRVGHVRVFAAMASLMSAAMVLYAALVDPIAWLLMRILVGFCMSSCYIVAESWLNDSTDNAHRGQVLSAYLIVQMMGIVLAQSLLNLADPAGYDLFVLMAVSVSVAVVPILLSATPVPVFETTKRMSLGALYRTSPLGVVGTVALGGVFACLFGMGAVYATEMGLSNERISIFIGAIYVGGMLLQYPIGWLSDRMERRLLIISCTAIGAAASMVALISGGNFTVLVAAAFVIGGMANPLYSLLIAHTNDFLEHDEMASAAGGLIMLNGLGAVGTPILVGYVMEIAGPASFMIFVGGILGGIALYALYRSTVRPSTPVDETVPIAPMAMVSGPVAGSYAQEIVAEQAEAEALARAEEEEEAAEPRTVAERRDGG
ncbi:MFS transporter [Paralimibaculum aggregatum]|uniref:MFS transporter n=1 Tax=Paralimibaculum aggregatum TaxID=3036245 RepID=A0ABQ6LNQ2_9RHOB|nr:MFS transporter [Limibaculum sp. NKW23]GMG83332.1 MFS transporter [Limibaculum sp. NKW23]